ncbi:MAG: 30S ribosomal protein S8 [Chloroflexi bacterium]|nr:30S ribosomal protein S8 [Chloroflexota bacterium]
MPVTDPISDMLTRIRNAVMSHHETVSIPHSRMKRSLLRILRDEGFIENVETHRDGAKADFEVKLRYYEDDESVITGLKRISKPGRRVYVGKNEIPRYFGGRGVAFLSTSKGVMTSDQARRTGVGGELLFYVW